MLFLRCGFEGSGKGVILKDHPKMRDPRLDCAWLFVLFPSMIGE